MYNIKLNLHISDGCILIEPNLIHLILPLTEVPTSGINNASSNKILTSIKIQSNLYKNSEGVIKKMTIVSIPSDINNNCLDAK